MNALHIDENRRAVLIVGTRVALGARARVSSFFVISNTSTFTYRGKAVDLTEVGRDLGVRYIFEDSIQKAGNRMRIFTQLVEAKTARMIWHDRHDRRHFRPSGYSCRTSGRGIGTQTHLGRSCAGTPGRAASLRPD